MRTLYEDDHIIVIDKDSGFLSVPGRGPEKRDSVAYRISELTKCELIHPEIHRLDMDTSGILVLAFDKVSQRGLSIQFQERTIQKKYFALLEGHLEGESGTIDFPMRLDVENRPHQIYDPVHGKPALTHWEKIAIEGPWTRVSFRPVTGRTHQLRVHAAHELGLSLPIVEDPLYGSGHDPGKMKLHAAELTFVHPISDAEMTFQTPPPF
ncbi:MAG: RluA family pseudouridine synthase [Akkermansiaceae bacterium]